MKPDDFPADKGTYLLILYLPASVTMTIGRLGVFHFPEGWYVYVGSAMGSGGLRGRLRHHLSPVTKPHWHIDYLRQSASVDAVWVLEDGLSHEHEWAGVLRSLSNAAMPVARFGASDCECPTHLFHFADCPAFDDVLPLRGLTRMSATAGCD